MSFPRYESYKDSGVEWLGEVPEHWDISGLKHQIRMRYGDALASEIREDGVIEVFGSNGPVGLHCIANTKAPAIIVGRKGSYGKIVWAENGGFVIDTAYSIDSDTTNLNLRWVYYALQPLGLDSLSQDTGVPGLAREKAYEMRIAVAPPVEQQTIAAFLDRETAKIDALIAEQQRLIALLKEKRQAVISHAVTKGLSRLAPSPQPLSHEGRGANAEALANSKHASATAATELPSPCGGGVGGEGVPMKDSGIAWLGEVPAHWIQTPIKHLLNGIIDTEHKTAPFFADGEYLVVRTTNIKNGKLVFDGAKYTDHDGYIEWTKRGIPEPGDILFTREAPAGEACLVPKDVKLCIGQRTVTMRVNHALLNSRFGLWSLYGGISAKFISDLSQGSTVAHFNMSDIGNIPIMVPLLEEQSAIADFLDQETSKLDTLTAEAQRAIALLKERRSALISAAVTGKIDVRQLELTSGEH